MDMKYQITCVVQSGRAVANAASVPTPASGTAAPAKAGSGDHPKGQTPPAQRLPSDITPGLNPMDDVHFTEVMVGQRKQFMVFKGPGHSPVVAAEEDNSPKQTATATPPGNGKEAKE